ncbi:MAG: InlB B-repeat-containing protein [Clostridiales bacterium]|nr:InlB B-repeat-containing protein [Clostridiales bacterium]
MKKFAAFSLVAVMILTCLVSAACFQVAVVYLHDYYADGKTKIQVYDPDEDMPIPVAREGYEFGGWYTDVDCTSPFESGTPMLFSFHLYAKWIKTGEAHTHDFGESYFLYVKCSVDGCDVYGRAEATKKYFSLSDYTLDKQMMSIDSHYNQLVANINNGNNRTQFDTLYDQYEQDVDTVIAQCDLAYLLSDVYTSFIDRYYDASEYYDITMARFYGLYEMIYNSNYRSYFYSGWTSEEIDEARDLAESYNSSSADQSELRDVIAQYNDLLDAIDDDKGPSNAQYTKLNNLYKRLVTAYNGVATSSGYSNYMDYAYENVYYREYSPSEVTKMRSYVKSVIAPLFVNVAQEYYSFYDKYYRGRYFINAANSNYFEGLTNLAVVDTVSHSISNFNTVKDTVSYIGDYYNYLSEVNGVDFFGEANKLYRNGNYFTGSGVGAYTGIFIDTPAIYFQEEDYSNAFTFVHEFGHYYDFTYNGEIYTSMDHNETQSQGNEMMFLAWLSQNKPTGITNGYDAVELNQLFDFLSTVVLATAVDEFEQAAYTGLYNGRAITDYNATFKSILSTYSGAASYLNTDYWFYVVFDNAAYYISYAMSALPALEIFAKAETLGLNIARDSYLKLFTYSSNSAFMGKDSYGDTVVTATYEEILNYCGLHSAFQGELYTTIQSYFNSRK